MGENLDIIDYGIDDARRDLPCYAVDAHKYTHGVLLVVGGSRDYSGAPMLAATAGLYAGAGIVKACIPRCAELFCHVPQALIVHRFAADAEHGVFAEESLPQFRRELEKAAAMVLGPGMMASHGEIDDFLKEAFAVNLPKVIDADALNRISLNPQLFTDCSARPTAVLTPHDGEFKRLVQAIAPKKYRAREEAVREMAKALGCVIVLKGPGTLVASADGIVTRNATGNNRLATAGTGDVLAGVIGALLAQGLESSKAARLGVFLHGLAADKLDAFIADDLAPCIAKLMHNGLY